MKAYTARGGRDPCIRIVGTKQSLRANFMLRPLYPAMDIMAGNRTTIVHQAASHITDSAFRTPSDSKISHFWVSLQCHA
jgi:hypothetical protein